MTQTSSLDQQPSTFAVRDRFTADDVDALLYGNDRTSLLVAAEFRSPNAVLLFQRTEDGQTRTIQQTFRPWLIARDPDSLRNLRPEP